MRYRPPHFQAPDADAVRSLITRHPLATLVLTGADGIDAEHLPMLLEHTETGHGVLRGHVARANPVWQQVPDGADALAIFHGPDHYVSPGWYPSKRAHGKVVPTWNYAVVHGHGRLTWQHDRDWLLALVTRLTDAHEAGRAAPWHVTDAPDDYVTRMLGAIVGVEIALTRLEGKWKQSQNRSTEDVAGVIAGLEADGSLSARDAAALMQETRSR
ncbi:MAG: FMN-binding negative transcriptional regulator [Pseudomonadales bacterium]